MDPFSAPDGAINKFEQNVNGDKFTRRHMAPFSFVDYFAQKVQSEKFTHRRQMAPFSEKMAPSCV